MGYLIKAGVGLILFFGSIYVFNANLVELMETGTCASGNTPYEIARPCPEGTGEKMWLVTGSIFAGLIGCAIFAFRGEPPWQRRHRRSAGFFGIGTFAWGFFFTATGVVMLYTGFANDTVGPDGELAGKIVGFTFLFMGLPAIAISSWTLFRWARSPRDESPQSVAGASSAGPLGGSTSVFGKGGGDTLGRLERLQKLRESGAINDSEFEREKSKILAEQ